MSPSPTKPSLPRRRLPSPWVVAGVLLVVLAATPFVWAHFAISRTDWDLSRARQSLSSPTTATSVPASGRRGGTLSPPQTVWPALTTSTTVSSAAASEHVLSEDLVVLLAGSDSRPGFGGSRADVIMVVVAPADSDEVRIVSIPRDLVVEVPCWGYTRINSALNGCPSKGVSGLELLAVTVEDWAGIEIDHVASTSFGGFVQAVDLLGGYEVCLKFPVRDRDAHLDLPAGCQTLDGEDTLALVRSRKTQELRGGRWRSVGASDFSRMARQRDVAAQLARRVTSVSSLPALTQAVAAVAQHVTVDAGWSVPEMAADLWAIRGRRIGGASLQGRSYINSRGMWVIEASESFDDAFRRADPNTSTVTSASSSSTSTTLPTTSTTAPTTPSIVSTTSTTVLRPALPVE